MSNDHFVPQHFLRAWAIDPEKKKLFGYQRIQQTNEIKFKERSIISTASAKDLYQISDGVQKAEFETRVMTEAVDTPMSAVVAKLRTIGLERLGQCDRELLARYITILEARNPRVIEQMMLSDVDLAKIMAEQLKFQVSPDAVAYVGKFMKSILPSSGKAAAGMFAGWGHGIDSTALLKKGWIEVNRSDGGTFLSSNYPVGRHGKYEDENSIISLAISPEKGLLFIPNDLQDTFQNSPVCELSKMIDLFTLARATEAYSISSLPNMFVMDHLGWMLWTDEKKYSEYARVALAAPIDQTRQPTKS